MIAALIFFNSRGDVVLSRTFRDGHNIRTLADAFRNDVISTKKADRSPVNILNELCYVHLKLTDLYVVMVSSANTNCFLCIQYGVRLLQVIRSYYGVIDETVLKENFVALQSIIDETMDYGYPQMTEVAALKEFISEDGLKVDTIKDAKESELVTAKVMGEVPWREEGLIYRVNEVFVDVFEDVNLLLAPSGDVLQSSVAGRVEVKNFLSGMPACELVLNTRAYGEAPTIGSSPSDVQPVQLNDVAFHTCVRLNQFDAQQQLQFTPPDGQFTLMTYRSSVDVRPPIRVLASSVREVSKTRIEIEFNLKVELPEKLSASAVEVRIPCPENTAHVVVKVGSGKAKFTPVEKAIVWKLASVRGGQEIPFVAELKQIAPTLEENETMWSRPPIKISFRCIAHSLTGLRVEELKVNEPIFMYSPNKWIRYMTGAGEYQCRI